MTKKIRLLLPFLILGIAVLVFLALKLTKPKAPAITVTERTWRVESLIVTPTPQHPELTLHGQITAPDQFTIVAPKAARIADLPVADGQLVEKAALLVRLDPADFQPAITQAKATIADIEAQIKSENIKFANDQRAFTLEQSIATNAEKNVERNRDLAKRKLLSASDVERSADALQQTRLALASREQALKTHPTKLNSLEAQLANAQAQLSVAERDAERATVVAPFDGIVNGVDVAQGDQVAANTKLLSFYPIAGLQVRATVPTRYATELQSALANKQDTDKAAIAWFEQNGKRVALHLSRLAGAATSEGLTAVFTFDKPDPALRLGQVLSFTLQRPIQADAVAVPYSALYGNGRVYLIQDGLLHSIDVDNLGDITVNHAHGLLITSPKITAGARVLTTHLPNAINGLRVTTGSTPEPITGNAP
jgi:HlyD family secretion protein